MLQLLLSYLASKPKVPVLIMGNFNCYLDPRKNRHPPISPLKGSRGTALSRLLFELGWTATWCIYNPDTKQFSCISKTHGSLSRIMDITQHNGLHLQGGVSDHSPLAPWLITQLPTSLPKAPWKLNAFWLKLFTSSDRIARQINGFFQSHSQYPDKIQKLEAFKAYLRGVFLKVLLKLQTLNGTPRLCWSRWETTYGNWNLHILQP